MRFQHSYLLVLIVPLVACWFVLFKRKASAMDLRRAPLLLLAAISLTIALANPYWSTVQEARTERGANFILMIDVSQSMFCTDGTPTRIDQARSFVRSILQQFEGSPVAIVYFAGDAQLGSPLTTDHPAIYLFMDSIVPAMAARSGTLAAPLETTMKDLLADITSHQTSRKQIGLLFSDGEFFDSDKGFRRWLSSQNDLTLFTFACGKGPAPVPKYDLSGSYPGAISKPNPAVLKELAESTGGMSYPVATANAAVVSNEMARRVTQVVAEGKMVPRYRYYPFLLAAVFLLLSYQLLPLFSLSIQKSKLVPAVSILIFAFAALAAGDQENIEGKFSQALKEIKQGRLEEGYKKLKDLESVERNEELEIAIGNVFLQKKQPEQAIQYYKNALRINPFNERARWNWEVAIKMQSGSQSPPPPPSPPSITPNQIPEESRALLDYFDQMEKEDRKQENKKNANESTFAW